MKKLIYIFLLLFICSFAYAQDPQPAAPGSSFSIQVYRKIFGPDTTTILYGNGLWTYLARQSWVNKYFVKKTDSAYTLPGGPITTFPAPGDNPGTNISPTAFIIKEFYGANPPTSSITGGTLYELTVSNKTHNLQYSYGRTSSTNPISAAVVNPGSVNVFALGGQPAKPGTISAPLSVTTTANTNTTYAILVTSNDGKTSSASTSDTFLPRLFYGRTSSTAPTTADILAFAGGSNPLLAGHAIGPIVIVASGANRPFIAHASNLGSITKILDINGFDVTSAFNTATISLTNSQGFTQNYTTYTLNAATSSNYTITTN